MASSKELKTRIQSVSNTRKITRTMEMVAASKLKRAQSRVTASSPYLNKLAEMLADLTKDAGPELVKRFPLLQQRDEVKRSLILLVSANRGLCGGFNTNLIRKARDLYREQEALGREVELHIVGKKGLSYFRFRGFDIAGEYTDVSDRPSFDDATRFAELLVPKFLDGSVDKVFIVFAHFKSAGRQPPTVIELLPVGPGARIGAPAVAPAEESEGPAALHQWEFAPSADAILGTLVPMFVRFTIFRALIESVASEQVARRIAMKNATDNAGDMITSLTRRYNRERQAAITQEIAEIVGGAAALE